MALNMNVSEKFRNAFEQKCFRLIIEAYQISMVEKVIQLDWNENDISSEIYLHINANPLRFKIPQISPSIEHHIPKDIAKLKGFADKFPRIDFRFTTFSINNEYEYFFEAKNLKQNDSALKRRYIDTGIDNFVSGKYSNGSLVGYLLEGGIADTINGINALLKKDNRHAEFLTLHQNILYVSTHLKIGVLKHLVFDYTSFSE